MNVVDVARRLGVHETQVVTVDVHAVGHVATLRDGRRMLISETVARVFVPEVDEPSRIVGEAGLEKLNVGDEPTTVVKPKARPKRAAGGGNK